MTPTHPTRIGTHRRIADILERGLSSVPGLAAGLRLDATTVHLALRKMNELGYARRATCRVPAPSNGRLVQAWELVPGAVVPSDSGAPGKAQLPPAVYVARILDTLRAGPKTRAEMLTATSMSSIHLYHVLSGLVDAGCITTTRRKTQGRPAFIYAFASEPADPSVFGICRSERETPPPPKTVDEDCYDTHSGTFSFGFIAGTETAPCPPAKTTVALAACIDGYVDATATGRQSPCNQCPTGRARRADYAGSDFEESDGE